MMKPTDTTDHNATDHSEKTRPARDIEVIEGFIRLGELRASTAAVPAEEVKDNPEIAVPLGLTGVMQVKISVLDDGTDYYLPSLS